MTFSLFLLLLCLPIIALGLWVAKDPQKHWWTFEAHRYRNPEIHEPSEWEYDRRRREALFGVFVMLVLMALLGWVFLQEQRQERINQNLRQLQKEMQQDLNNPEKQVEHMQQLRRKYGLPASDSKSGVKNPDDQGNK